MTQTPHIVIVPGAWHPASCYQAFATALEGHDYQVQILTHPSVQYSREDTTAADDEEAARAALVTILDQGHEVVLVTHSYGGKIGAAAASGLSVQARSSKGQLGGVVGFICITSAMVKGVPPQSSSGKFPPFIVPDTPSPGLCSARSPIEFFYPDVESSVAEQLIASLRPVSFHVFTSLPRAEPVWDEEELEGRIAYIRCLQDRVISVAIQDYLLETSGRKWTTKTIDASHSAWASKPEETAELVVDIVREFGL